jgi:hypothetical protein
MFASNIDVLKWICITQILFFSLCVHLDSLFSLNYVTLLIFLFLIILWYYSLLFVGGCPHRGQYPWAACGVYREPGSFVWVFFGNGLTCPRGPRWAYRGVARGGTLLFPTILPHKKPMILYH